MQVPSHPLPNRRTDGAGEQRPLLGAGTCAADMANDIATIRDSAPTVAAAIRVQIGVNEFLKETAKNSTLQEVATQLETLVAYHVSDKLAEVEALANAHILFRHAQRGPIPGTTAAACHLFLTNIPGREALEEKQMEGIIAELEVCSSFGHWSPLTRERRSGSCPGPVLQLQAAI
jgi:hypothetical protein